MKLRLSIRQWFCAILMLPLVGGQAFGDGVVVDPAAAGCPACGSPGCPTCPANVKYYGYYPTLWRRWPGTEPMPVVEPSRAPRPSDVEVPSPEQEAAGRPSANSEPGTSGASAAPVPETNLPALPGATGGATAPKSTTPGSTTPGGTLPGTTNPGTPMLNGMPVPSGSQLPNGMPVPVPHGSAPNILPPPNSSDSTGKGSQLFTPIQNPYAIDSHQSVNEAAGMNSQWSAPPRAIAMQPATIPTALQPSDLQPAPAIRFTPAPLAIQPIPNQPNELPSAATEAVQPIGQAASPEATPQWPPANMLRPAAIKAGYQTPEKVSSLPVENSASKPCNTTVSFGQTSNCEAHDSLTLVTDRPAQPASIATDDWSPDHNNGVTSGSPASNSSAVVAARFTIPADSNQNHFVQPANSPAQVQGSESRPVDWSRANSPAALAPIYPSQSIGRPYSTPNAAQFVTSGYANGNRNSDSGLNAPGTLSMNAPAATMQIPSASPAAPSQLREAVVNLHPMADERQSTAIGAINPVQIGAAMADDRQPAMRPLPVESSLSKDRFQVSDYVPQDRVGQTANTAGAGQPISDGRIQQASYVQPVPGEAPKLQSIDPLEAARSLGPAPGAPAQAATGN